MRKSGESFEQFYMNKVALGEGCGCAEMIVPVHDQNRRADIAGVDQPNAAAGVSFLATVRSLASRLGLRRR